ncbi:hypothetical protein V8C86DRAFT_2551578 [Haematococcus lacustris]
MARIGVLAFIALLLTSIARADEFTELFQWVKDNGGMVNVAIKTNKDGVRGLFSTAPAKAGDFVATVNSACMINAGATTGNIMTGTLLVLRELFDPHSRFKPYIKTWPSRTQVLNQCNMPHEYFPLLDSPELVRRILEYQSYLGAVLEGHVNLQLEFTIKEMLGSANVTLDDLKYGCAVATTRYVTIEGRNRVMMIPIFDMSNHKRKCAHTTTALEGGDEVSVVIGEDVEADTELCYPYTPDMRDDHGVLNYGFLPDPEDPPRLLQVDHPEYSPSDSNKPLSEEPFEADSADGYLSEMDRLTQLLDDLQQVDANFDEAAWPAPGTDYVFDMLMGLKQRRREAIRYEVARLASKLEALTAGKQEL